MSRFWPLIAWIPGAKAAFRSGISARCFACKRDWRDAKPFVEGADGFLICRRCIQVERLPREGLCDDAELAEFPPVEFIRDNPYASPSVTDVPEVCRLCGNVVSDKNTISAGPFKLCGPCIEIAKRLVGSVP